MWKSWSSWVDCRCYNFFWSCWSFSDCTLPSWAGIGHLTCMSVHVWAAFTANLLLGEWVERQEDKSDSLSSDMMPWVPQSHSFLSGRASWQSPCLIWQLWQLWERLGEEPTCQTWGNRKSSNVHKFRMARSQKGEGGDVFEKCGFFLCDLWAPGHLGSSSKGFLERNTQKSKSITSGSSVRQLLLLMCMWQRFYPLISREQLWGHC